MAIGRSGLRFCFEAVPPDKAEPIYGMFRDKNGLYTH